MIKNEVSATFQDAGALYDFMGKAPLGYDSRENVSLVNLGYWNGLNSFAALRSLGASIFQSLPHFVGRHLPSQ